MAAATFDTFLEALREPSQATLSPARLANALHIGANDLADLACVDLSTIADSPDAAQLQDTMHDIVRVLAAAYEVNEDIESVTFWFVNHPLTEFGHQTPATLVRHGKVDAVVAYIASIAGGPTG